MASPVKALLYGLLVWLIPFVISFLVFGYHEDERALFESIMAVALAGTVVVLGVLYFKSLETQFVREGLVVGILWYVVSAGIDALMFGYGPEEMRMSVADYMKDIGLTYLMIPAITLGFGYLLRARQSES